MRAWMLMVAIAAGLTQAAAEELLVAGPEQAVPSGQTYGWGGTSFSSRKLEAGHWALVMAFSESSKDWSGGYLRLGTPLELDAAWRERGLLRIDVDSVPTERGSSPPRLQLQLVESLDEKPDRTGYLRIDQAASFMIDSTPGTWQTLELPLKAFKQLSRLDRIAKLDLQVVGAPPQAGIAIRRVVFVRP